MVKLIISKLELLNLYNKAIDELTDECDWITYIDGKIVCATIVSILIENKVNCFINSDLLYELYSDYIKSLNLTDNEWVEKYGVEEIITIIYAILEEHAE